MPGTLVIFTTTYSALGQRGCVEGRGQRGQQEVGCWIYLPLPVWALSPYVLSPAGQQTSWQLGFGEGEREGNIEDSTEWNRGHLDKPYAQMWKMVKCMTHKQWDVPCAGEPWDSRKWWVYHSDSVSPRFGNIGKRPDKPLAVLKPWYADVRVHTASYGKHTWRRRKLSNSLAACCAKALVIKYFRRSYDVGLNKQTRTAERSRVFFRDLVALQGGKIMLEGTCGDAEWTRPKKGFS